MFNVGPGELIAILALALIVLGPQRLPEAVRTVGRVVGELRRISSGFQEELRNALDDSEVERDLDRLRAVGDGRDGEGQAELPLDDQPELPLGAVQYPTGIEPIDVDATATPAAPDGTSNGDADPDAEVASGTVAEPAELSADAEPPEVRDPEPSARVGEDAVAPTAAAAELGHAEHAGSAGRGVAGEAEDEVEEPDKDPAIDDDPDEPYEPSSDGNDERAAS